MMKRYIKMLSFTWLLSFALHSYGKPYEHDLIDIDYKILVDKGPFLSVQQASTAQQGIKWNSADFVRMNACTESYAAVELQTYLRKLNARNVLTGETGFSIVPLTRTIPGHSIILTDLGQATRNNEIAEVIKSNDLTRTLSKEESFAFIPADDKFYIIGNNRIGTLYGVYHLLEVLGVRWFAPGTASEFIPSVTTLAFPKQKLVLQPDYLARGFWAWEDRGGEEFLTWMARNRLNFWTLAEHDKALLHKLGIHLTIGGHVVWQKFLLGDQEYPYNHPLFKNDENKPADPYQPGAEYAGDVNHDNKLSYYEAHPEWYGLINGKREKIVESNFGTNVCTSDQDAINEFSRNLLKALTDGEWEGADVVGVWPLDIGKWCECNKCRQQGEPTDRLMVLVNQVNKAIQKARKNNVIHRNIKIHFPIYVETEAPPQRPLPKDFDYDNCVGTFFPMFRDYIHFIDDSACTEFNTSFYANLKRWTDSPDRFFKGQVCIGEYFNISTMKSLPVVFTKVIGHDIPLYHKHGARDFHYMHVSTSALGMKRLNNYLLAKMLWNVHADPDSIYNDYLQNCYGRAAFEMRELYDTIEYALSNIQELKSNVSTSLKSRINLLEDSLFVVSHLQLYPRKSTVNNGVSLVESLGALRRCRTIMDKALQMDLPAGTLAYLHEDESNLAYAENMYRFYYDIVMCIQSKDAGKLTDAANYYRQSIPVAKALQSETVITSSSSAHANSPDGLAATGIMDTYINLGKFMGIKPPTSNNN